MKILITGGTGMVGSAFKSLSTSHKLTFVGSGDYDLRDKDQAYQMLNTDNYDAVIHLAAKVGGVKGNSDYVAEFFYDNIMINANVLNAAQQHSVPKVVSLLSTCIYPDNPTYPLTEDQIHSGEPHQSNFGYAYAKRMLEVHSRAIRKQYGLKYITAVPNNIYGPNDNFDLENGHVVPAIIRKLHSSLITGKPASFWGSGSALREFTYSEDIANILLWMVENYDSALPLNIGCTDEISIYDLVQQVKNILKNKGETFWDTAMPEGQYKKPSCNDRFLRLSKGYKYTPLLTGLKTTVEWYLETYPNVRGI